MFDADGNDEISKKEFYASLKQLLIDFDGMSFDDVTAIFDTIDVDSSGSITYNEFKSWFDQVKHLQPLTSLILLTPPNTPNT